MDEVSDEMLMAYADGALDPDTEQALRRRLDADPQLRERLAPFVSTAPALAPLRALEAQPVPQPWLDAIDRWRGAEPAAPPEPATTARPAPGRDRSGWLARWLGPVGPWAPALATLVIGVVVGLQWPATPPVGSPQAGAVGASGLAGWVTAQQAWVDAGARGDVVEEAAPSARRARIVGAFRGEGGVCREVEATGADAREVVLMCRAPDGRWAPRLVVAWPAAAGYAPASGTPPELDMLLSRAAAGGPMSAADEEAARRSGWR